jgi:Neutral/alkaline non-lysosomal ceramidase, N-terminal
MNNEGEDVRVTYFSMRIIKMKTIHYKFHCVILIVILALLPKVLSATDSILKDPILKVGMGTSDITPELKKGKPVWLAGLASNRSATGVLDHLHARAMVLKNGQTKIAFVSVDLLGLQYHDVLEVRKVLNDFSYVMVASTHTHEAPDVIGLWGPSPEVSGIDPGYIHLVRNGIISAVRKAEKNVVPVKASYGTTENYSLLKDFRLPNVYDPILRVLKFERLADGKSAGILVQWNSHPIEPDKNSKITRDFMGVTVDRLEKSHGCPVIYFSGAIGGLMGTSIKPFLNSKGKPLFEDHLELIQLYGKAVADVADKALQKSEPIQLVPLKTYSKTIYVPFPNEGFRKAKAAGLLPRPVYTWIGHRDKKGTLVPQSQISGEQAAQSEVAYLRLGELHIATIPGELYPEFVYGEYQDPIDPGADYPNAQKEKTVTKILPGKKILVIGLANDAIGYIVPKRQWDVKPPFAYKRKSSQYGEVNSMGPETGKVLMESLFDRVNEASGQK